MKVSQSELAAATDNIRTLDPRGHNGLSGGTGDKTHAVKTTSYCGDSVSLVEEEVVKLQ